MTDCYWILEIQGYGTIIFYGTQEDAFSLYKKRLEWEGPNAKGSMKMADPENEIDRGIVVRELIAVSQDTEAGVKGLPVFPRKGWMY
jgi:hypothetical protein